MAPAGAAVKVLPRGCFLPDTAQSCAGCCWEWHGSERAWLLPGKAFPGEFLESLP